MSNPLYFRMDAGGGAISADHPLPVSTVPSGIPGSATAWSYASAGAITNTSDVVLKAAGAAGVVNYLASMDIANSDATVATEVVIKDGSTIIWRRNFGALYAGAGTFNFSPPLKSTAATALNVACITTSSETYVNAQGYSA